MSCEMFRCEASVGQHALDGSHGASVRGKQSVLASTGGVLGRRACRVIAARRVSLSWRTGHHVRWGLDRCEPDCGKEHHAHTRHTTAHLEPVWAFRLNEKNPVRDGVPVVGRVGLEPTTR
jgi:hypothetical protein